MQSSPVRGLEWPRRFQEVKVKQSRYRPGVAQRVPGIKVPRFLDNGTGWW
jgi:hypothetical protein